MSNTKNISDLFSKIDKSEELLKGYERNKDLDNYNKEIDTIVNEINNFLGSNNNKYIVRLKESYESQKIYIKNILELREKEEKIKKPSQQPILEKMKEENEKKVYEIIDENYFDNGNSNKLNNKNFSKIIKYSDAIIKKYEQLSKKQFIPSKDNFINEQCAPSLINVGNNNIDEINENFQYKSVNEYINVLYDIAQKSKKLSESNFNFDNNNLENIKKEIDLIMTEYNKIDISNIKK